ncbi:monovalent cation:proton antiporter-2 (CPA2) family protein [Arenimonas sp. MALMAid1274]|uniref:monovalent cation:proton antiporter-2 (CPA2) family protein n=1 Tax=Arenimonas sp. MALMAid1274 TaxID=3411630 RepID=UPI003BA19D08
MHGNDGYLGIILVFLIATVIAVPLFRRLGLGAILGYLVAGVAIGPDGLKLVPDPEDVLAASEFGVVMLLFIIGLELSPPRLWVMRRQVFGTGGLQVLVSALAVAFFAGLFLSGWKAPFVVGMGLALSSTAVGLQLLAERKELTAEHGRVAFAILLFQDLVAIPLLAAIPLLGQAKALARSAPPLESVLVAVAAILALVVLGRFLLRYLLRMVARANSVEVFTATALLVVVASAWLMQWAGLSMGLGAFLAGVLLADSEFRHELESHIEPFKGLFLGLFFIAVGMSIDVDLIRNEPALIASGVLLLLAVKTGVLLVVGRTMGGLPLRGSLMLGAVLAMGGEFGFVVFAEALKAGLISEALRDQLFVIIALSMAATPLVLLAVSRWLRHAAPATTARAPDTIDNGHPRVIIAGFGRMGQIVGRMLRDRKIAFTALETSAEQVEFLRRFGNKIYFGDPARPELLRAANAAHAEVFVITTDDPDANIRTARVVKRLFPHLKVFARARNRQHAFKLMDMDVQVTRETFHSSLVMGRRVMEALGVPPEEAARNAESFREHDEALLRQQHLVYDDEAALVASAREAQRELESLFEADAPEVADVDAAAAMAAEEQASRVPPARL